MTKSLATQSPPDVRRNWGYWDGVAAAAKRRRPLWSPSWTVDRQHPSDKTYGKAFWAGWRGEDHPNKARYPQYFTA